MHEAGGAGMQAQSLQRTFSLASCLPVVAAAAVASYRANASE